jgi:hypothetical protein
MVLAVYTSPEVIALDNEVKSIRDAFARGKIQFHHWGFTDTSSDNNSEEREEGISTILRFTIKNDRVTPFANDEEIHDMFMILLQEGTIFQAVFTSNQNNQRLISITFNWNQG